jgi:hypothetical protein
MSRAAAVATLTNKTCVLPTITPDNPSVCTDQQSAYSVQLFCEPQEPVSAQLSTPVDSSSTLVEVDI